MGKKNFFGWADPTLVEEWQIALEKGHDLITGWERGDVTDNIQMFLEGSFRMGSNPLPHLRKIFPLFEWKFLDIGKRLKAGDGEAWSRARCRMVEPSDFFWVAAGLHGGFAEYFVARKIRGQEPPMRIYATGTFEDLANIGSDGVQYVEEFKSFGAREARGSYKDD